MRRTVLFGILVLLAFACIVWAADRSWTGVISDSTCGLKHATAGDDAAACVTKCISGGGKYVLVSGGKLYQLTPQDKISASLAGRGAKISGTLAGDTITVSSSVAAPPMKKGAGL
jgi:hypothetical protein